MHQVLFTAQDTVVQFDRRQKNNYYTHEQCTCKCVYRRIRSVLFMLADMFMYMYVYEKIRNVSFVLIDMLGCTCTCMCLLKDQDCFFYVGRHARLVSLLQKLRGTLNPETSLSLCKGASHPVLHQTECVHNQMDKVREYLPNVPSKTLCMQVCFSVFLVYKTLWARLKKNLALIIL